MEFDSRNTWIPDGEQSRISAWWKPIWTRPTSFERSVAALSNDAGLAVGDVDHMDFYADFVLARKWSIIPDTTLHDQDGRESFEQFHNSTPSIVWTKSSDQPGGLLTKEQYHGAYPCAATNIMDRRLQKKSVIGQHRKKICPDRLQVEKSVIVIREGDYTFSVLAKTNV